MVGAAALLANTPPKVATFHADPSSLVRGLYRVGSPLLRRWARRAAVVTAVSPVAARAIAPFAEARLVPNGIDTADYAVPRVRRVAERVAFLGRDDPRKGLDVLLSAWPSVRTALPDAELHVIGSERDVKPPGVVWLGRVPETFKRQELAAATVFCAPNTGGESFGIVVVEAMAAGCAVVASDLPSFGYVLGDAGMLVPPEDPEALADTLVTVLSTPEVTAELSARSRTRAQTFDRSQILGKYLQAYEDAIG
jgi:phosphatidylinositol alpha-mannosyltransferase